MAHEVIEMKDRDQKMIRLTKWRKWTRKKYVIPALYLLLASIVLTGILYFKNDGGNVDEKAVPKETNELEEESLAVSKQKETFKWPVKDERSLDVLRPFYDQASSEEEREKAIVVYDNVYYQNQGIDVGKKDGEVFDVVAALSGTVTKVTEDSLFGHVVTIEHKNDITTHYQSLGEVIVAEGQAVKQGDTIGIAGRNAFNKEIGTHLHFEVRAGGKAYNPATIFNQPVSILNQLAETTDEDEEENKDEKRKEEQPEEEEKPSENDNKEEERRAIEENQSNQA